MGRLIDDDMLHTIAACGSPGEIAAHIRDRVARRLRSDLRLPARTDRGAVAGADRRRAQRLSPYRGTQPDQRRLSDMAARAEPNTPTC